MTLNRLCCLYRAEINRKLLIYSPLQVLVLIFKLLSNIFVLVKCIKLIHVTKHFYLLCLLLSDMYIVTFLKTIIHQKKTFSSILSLHFAHQLSKIINNMTSESEDLFWSTFNAGRIQCIKHYLQIFPEKKKAHCFLNLPHQ